MVFTEDDNLLPPDYLQVVVDFFSEFRHLGCIGAWLTETEYEITPPDELLYHLPMLALRSETRLSWSNSPHKKKL